jgi:hypothetical protein
MCLPNGKYRRSDQRRACLWVDRFRNVFHPGHVSERNLKRHHKLEEVRQRLRLTATEKRVVAFIIAAFVLGFVTKCYRDAHPSPPLSQFDSR